MLSLEQNAAVLGVWFSVFNQNANFFSEQHKKQPQKNTPEQQRFGGCALTPVVKCRTAKLLSNCLAFSGWQDRHYLFRVSLTFGGCARIVHCVLILSSMKSHANSLSASACCCVFEVCCLCCCWSLSKLPKRLTKNSDAHSTLRVDSHVK